MFDGFVSGYCAGHTIVSNSYSPSHSLLHLPAGIFGVIVGLGIAMVLGVTVCYDCNHTLFIMQAGTNRAQYT